MNNNFEIQVHGVYSVDENPDVFLVELSINDSPSNVDLMSFVQEDKSKPRDSWQTAYDEHYLNDSGTEVIGRCFENERLMGIKTRLAFFMYFIDFGKPLLSQYGEIKLPNPTPMPDRLARIIDFEDEY